MYVPVILCIIAKQTCVHHREHQPCIRYERVPLRIAQRPSYPLSKSDVDFDTRASYKLAVQALACSLDLHVNLTQIIKYTTRFTKKHPTLNLYPIILWGIPTVLSGHRELCQHVRTFVKVARKPHLDFAVPRIYFKRKVILYTSESSMCTPITYNYHQTADREESYNKCLIKLSTNIFFPGKPCIN